MIGATAGFMLSTSVHSWKIKTADLHSFFTSSASSKTPIRKHMLVVSATAMKDVIEKLGEEQSPPASPSVIRDESRQERRE